MQPVQGCFCWGAECVEWHKIPNMKYDLAFYTGWSLLGLNIYVYCMYKNNDII